MASVEHFEIPADDVERAQTFYGNVFGFTYEPWGDDMGMLMTGGGINGDVHQRGVVPHPTVVITVDDIEQTLSAIVEAGGERVGEIVAMSEQMRYAYFRDTEGNLVGVVEHA